MADDINGIDIHDRINECYASPEYSELLVKLHHESFMEVIRKDSDELAHSAFLCWLFKAPEMLHITQSPLAMLMKLLAAKGVKHTALCPDLRELILISKIEFKNVDVKVEQAFPYVDVADTPKKGRIDIEIEADVRLKYTDENNKDVTEDKAIRIIIENKVKTKEHDEQCSTYYTYYSTKKNDRTTIYVFLSPNINEGISDEEHFIKISYQDILDRILYPVIGNAGFIPEIDTTYIKMFIDNITSLKNGIAMDKDTKVLLKKFLHNNRDIIEMAILDSDDPNDKVLKNAVTATLNNRAYKYKFTYNGATQDNDGNGYNGHTTLIGALVEYLAYRHSFEELEKILNTKGCKTIYDKEKVKEQKNGNLRYTTFGPYNCKGGKNVYVTNQWTGDKMKTLMKHLKEGFDGELKNVTIEIIDLTQPKEDVETFERE
jgi:hypothetical protein